LIFDETRERPEGKLSHHLSQNSTNQHDSLFVLLIIYIYLFDPQSWLCLDNFWSSSKIISFEIQYHCGFDRKISRRI